MFVNRVGQTEMLLGVLVGCEGITSLDEVEVCRRLRLDSIQSVLGDPPFFVRSSLPELALTTDHFLSRTHTTTPALVGVAVDRTDK